MQIRADLTEPARVARDDWAWVESPQAGVSRVMLDRVGDEVAVATSLVRYAPNSRFPSHDHAKGEEFIVLEGEFADEHGRFPPFSYVRNPPGSHHAPFSDPGCLIWVKLRQFRADDLTQMGLLLDQVIPQAGQTLRVLHEHADERVAEITAASGVNVIFPAATVPQEVLVLEGEIEVDGELAGPLDWLRAPADTRLELKTLAPCRLFWKTRPALDAED